MPRKPISHSVPEKEHIIDMKTGEFAEKTKIPVICEKIRYYREKIGIEQKELALKIGISGNAVCNWENGRSRPDINLIPDICKTLNISLYELFDIDNFSDEYTSREKLLINNYRQLSDGNKYAAETLIDTLIKVQAMQKSREICKLTYFSKSLAAGTADPTEFEDAGEPIYLYASDKIKKSNFVFTVNGDSMEPDFYSGDMVLVQRISDNTSLKYGEIGAFITGNETYIKVYEKDGLHSLNPNYKTIRFTDEDFVYLIGRVTGKICESDIASEDDVKMYALIHSDNFGK